MKYMYVAKREAGLVKKVNQDSVLIQHVKYKNKEALLAIVCDGVGGLAQGEFANANIVYGFSEWMQESVFKTRWICDSKKFRRAVKNME